MRNIISNMDPVALVFLLIITIISAIVILTAIIFKVRNFSQELEYINCEILRSQGREKLYWQRKRKKLFLSLIPFVRYRY